MTSATRGLVVAHSNDELERQRQEEVQEPPQAEEAVRTQLAAHIRRKWRKAYQAKITHEERMLENLRQRNGEYSPQKLRAIRQQGGSEIFMMLTAIKCRAAKSWIRDILQPSGDRPWMLTPSHTPDLHPEQERALIQKVQADAQQFMMATGQRPSAQQAQQVMQQAREAVKEEMQKRAEHAAERMSDTLEQLLREGGWASEFDKMISDLVDFSAGIIKGPVIRRSQKLQWGQDGQPIVEPQLRPEVQHVSPFDLYPQAGAEEIDDDDIIERHRLTRGDIYDLIGVPGYDEDAIRKVLQRYRDGGLNEWLVRAVEEEKQRANDADTLTWNDDHIDALEFWGSVPGSLLLEWGVDPDSIDDPEREYDIAAWLIDTEVIKVEFNPDPIGRKPYSKASFEQVPGSFWGRGVPDLIEDAQAVCNAAARSLVNNMGIASGPQVAVDTASIPPGEDIEEMYPWKIWQLDFREGQTGRQPPVHFFQPNPMVNELMAVYEKYAQIADEHSGIPSYTYGNSNVGGGGRTASGLSMLMDAASKTIKNVIAHIDEGVIVPTVRRYWEWAMRYHPDQSIKGDVRIVARGAMALVAREQLQMRRMEFLQTTNNPLDAEIIGRDGRRAVLAEIAKDLDIPRDDVVPSKEEMQQKEQAEQMAAQQQAMMEQGASPQGGSQPGSAPQQGGSQPGSAPPQGGAPQGGSPQGGSSGPPQGAPSGPPQGSPAPNEGDPQ
ncbi:MAG: portal protein [Armatimonadota bacterium]